MPELFGVVTFNKFVPIFIIPPAEVFRVEVEISPLAVLVLLVL